MVQYMCKGRLEHQINFSSPVSNRAQKAKEEALFS